MRFWTGLACAWWFEAAGSAAVMVARAAWSVGGWMLSRANALRMVGERLLLRSSAAMRIDR